MRSAITSSWQRAERSGLRREDDVVVDVEDSHGDGVLARAARPVVESLAEQLDGSGCALLLADRTQRIVLSRFSERRVGNALEDVVAVPGATYSEATSGTNAIATAFETGRGVYVLGEEHYLDKLQRFRCYGQPIHHPITGALEGVLDITGIEADTAGLMRALIVTAARAVEQQLLLDSPVAHTRLLGAYQARVARSRWPVLAFGHDITLCNDAATSILDEASVQELRALCAGLGPVRDERALRAAWSGPEGQTDVRVLPVEGVSDAFVLEVLSGGSSSSAGPRGRVPAAVEEGVLTVGEPGSGRTTRAASLVAGASAVWVWPTLDPTAVRDLLGSADRPEVWVLDGVDEFSASVLDLVMTARPAGSSLIATSATADAPFASRWRPSRTIELAPLRERRGELPQLVRALVAGHADQTDRPTRVTTAALDRMLRYWWPGNLTELAAVVADAVAAGRGVVDVAQLPPRVALATNRSLTPLEQAEYRTMSTSLERHGGNKSQVADELGIGRSTLYRRMRALGLD